MCRQRLAKPVKINQEVITKQGTRSPKPPNRKSYIGNMGFRVFGFGVYGLVVTCCCMDIILGLGLAGRVAKSDKAS